MGIKVERQKLLNYKEIYHSLKFTHSENAVRISGKINAWNDIEPIVRIFYKKLERLLYTPAITDLMYEKAIKTILKQNNLLDKNLYDIIKQKGYQIEAINILLIKVFDFVYFTIKKKLPYTKKLSLITNAISELLENTYKYTDGKFCITAGITKPDSPLLIKIENYYDDKTDETTKKNLTALENGIKEVAAYDDPQQVLLEVMKNRMENENSDSGSTEGESRLGFAKMRSDTGAQIRFSNSSGFFKEHGVSIFLLVPIEKVEVSELESIINNAFKNKV